MSFQWLQMRITEEQDRREREAQILERLPGALEELDQSLTSCIASYTAVFGGQSADIRLNPPKLLIVVRESTPTGWRESGRVEIDAVAEMPGFAILIGGSTLAIEIGILPGDRLFYKDRELDQFLTMEELTRRILDRALFPKLKE
jgi:hypothetical protein